MESSAAAVSCVWSGVKRSKNHVVPNVIKHPPISIGHWCRVLYWAKIARKLGFEKQTQGKPAKYVLTLFECKCSEHFTSLIFHSEPVLLVSLASLFCTQLNQIGSYARNLYINKWKRKLWVPCSLLQTASGSWICSSKWSILSDEMRKLEFDPKSRMFVSRSVSCCWINILCLFPRI